MNRQIQLAALLEVITCCWSAGVMADCEPGEYAELKDRALSGVSGRLSLATDYCLFAAEIQAQQKYADLGLKYGQWRDVEKAHRISERCFAAQSKIATVLTAAKAYKAFDYINAGCNGDFEAGAAKPSKKPSAR